MKSQTFATKAMQHLNNIELKTSKSLLNVKGKGAENWKMLLNVLKLDLCVFLRRLWSILF